MTQQSFSYSGWFDTGEPPITAESILRLLSSVPLPMRRNAWWVMNTETLKRVQQPPEAERGGVLYSDPAWLFGLPIKIDPDVQGIMIRYPEPLNIHDWA
jgi:hypothetical protein